MIINRENVELAFKGFQALFADGVKEAESHYDKVSMTVPSSSDGEDYGWLGDFQGMREWVGPRVVSNLTASGFTIKNKTFESTVRVKRTDYEDDKIGIFAPMFRQMGQMSRRHANEMVFGLLTAGFASACYDGKTFFADDHPVKTAADDVVAVSNMQAGAGPAWFLLDTSQAIRPLIWQERIPYEFQALNERSQSERVFMHDEYLYGVRARANAGFGLWQLAFGSKADLTAPNYASARAAMMNLTADGGRKLGIMPKLMVVPPSLEEAALTLLNTDTMEGGGSNPWKGTAQLVVTPWAA